MVAAGRVGAAGGVAEGQARQPPAVGKEFRLRKETETLGWGGTAGCRQGVAHGVTVLNLRHTLRPPGSLERQCDHKVIPRIYACDKIAQN